MAKYTDYADVFSSDQIIELPENMGMKEYEIELIDEKKLLYGPIYALSPVELETLKAYLKTHLKIRFIRPFKFLAGTLIFFNKKLDGSFYLYVDYQGLNNLTIKNQYALLLIREALDCLGQAKQLI